MCPGRSRRSLAACRASSESSGCWKRSRWLTHLARSACTCSQSRSICTWSVASWDAVLAGCARAVSPGRGTRRPGLEHAQHRRRHADLPGLPWRLWPSPKRRSSSCSSGSIAFPKPSSLQRIPYLFWRARVRWLQGRHDEVRDLYEQIVALEHSSTARRPLSRRCSRCCKA